MSDKKGKSPKDQQPKRKKRRVKSNKGTKGHNQSVNIYPPGVSTVQNQNTPESYDFSSQPGTPNFVFGANMSQFQNPQPMQVAGMQGAWYSPPPQGDGPAMGMGVGQVMNYKPDWAVELIESVKQVKTELGKLGGIEKSLSNITLQISNLETKVGTVETKVNNCEASCNFLSEKYQTQKKELENARTELKSAKTEVTGLKSRCDAIEVKSREHQAESSKFQRKLYDLESRSMRENLVFNGLPETANENCEFLVKAFCQEKLQMESTEVNQIVFDRIHRIGRLENLKPGNIRPIVAKFHRYSERERVRQAGYEKRDALKRENLAVRAQLPQEVLEKRKPLYPVFEKAKNDGERVKFVLDKLYINGREYVPPL